MRPWVLAPHLEIGDSGSPHALVPSGGRGPSAFAPHGSPRDLQGAFGVLRTPPPLSLSPTAPRSPQCFHISESAFPFPSGVPAPGHGRQGRGTRLDRGGRAQHSASDPGGGCGAQRGAGAPEFGDAGGTELGREGLQGSQEGTRVRVQGAALFSLEGVSRHGRPARVGWVQGRGHPLALSQAQLGFQHTPPPPAISPVHT